MNSVVARVRVLRSLARHLGGGVCSGGPWRAPHVRFEVDGVVGRASALPWRKGDRSEPALTRVAMTWWPRGQMRIGPETFISRMARLIGTRDVEIGDPAFDRRFRIQGTPQAWVRRVLIQIGREPVTELADLMEQDFGTREWRIEAGLGGLQAICRADGVQDPESFVKLVDGVIRLFRALRPPQAAEVAILAADESAEEATCPICGTAMAPPLKRCGECQTLHHEDCWNYLGGCAVFACSSARDRRAEQRAALRREAAERRRAAVKSPAREVTRAAAARRRRRRRLP